MAVIPECVSANLTQAFSAVRANAPDGVNCDGVVLIAEVRRTEWSADFSVHTGQFPPPDSGNQQRAKVLFQNRLSSRGRVTTCDLVTMLIPSGLIRKWRVGYLPPTEDVATSDENFPEVINQIPPTSEDRKKARHNENRLKKGKLVKLDDGSLHKTKTQEPKDFPASTPASKTNVKTMYFYGKNSIQHEQARMTRSQRNGFFAWLRRYCKGMSKQVADIMTGKTSISSNAKSERFPLQPFVSGRVDEVTSHVVEKATADKPIPDVTPKPSTADAVNVRCASSTPVRIDRKTFPAQSYSYSDFDITVGRLCRDPLIPAALYDLTHCPCRYSKNASLTELDRSRRAASMAIIDREGLHLCLEDFEKLLSGLVERTGYTHDRLSCMVLPAAPSNALRGRQLHMYCFASTYGR